LDAVAFRACFKLPQPMVIVLEPRCHTVDQVPIRAGWKFLRGDPETISPRARLVIGRFEAAIHHPPKPGQRQRGADGQAMILRLSGQTAQRNPRF